MKAFMRKNENGYLKSQSIPVISLINIINSTTLRLYALNEHIIGFTIHGGEFDGGKITFGSRIIYYINQRMDEVCCRTATIYDISSLPTFEKIYSNYYSTHVKDSNYQHILTFDKISHYLIIETKQDKYFIYAEGLTLCSKETKDLSTGASGMAVLGPPYDEEFGIISPYYQLWDDGPVLMDIV